LGDPYVAQHTPWYEDETRLSAEEQHYRAHTSATFSNWSVGKRDSWVQRSQRVACFDRRARVLHMDASAQYIPGWINAGADPQRRDLTFDVRRERPLRLDLDDNSLDGIHLSHVLEGVSDPQALFAELHRVAKPNAKLLIRVRHGARDDAWQDPSQHSVWTECSFSRYSQPAQTAVSDYGGDWDVVEVRLVVDPQACAMSDDQLRDAVLVQRNLIGEMVVTLRAIKPARAACGTRLVSRPAPVIVRDARIDPAFDVV
jgi:SAM-dependent methyltransferase